MLRTFAKNPMQINFRQLAACSLAALFLCSPVLAAEKAARAEKAPQAEALMPGVVAVSDFEFNTFIFPDTISRIFFPAGSPVVGKPIYLQNNSQVMLQFAKGQSKPVQMVAELEGGGVVSLRVLPKAIPGVSHTVSAGKPKVRRVESGSSGAVSDSPRAEDIELLKAIATFGEPPDDFTPVPLPAPVRFDKFTVVPTASWSDESRRILIFSVVAVPGQTAVLSPPQFYRPGVSAVIVDGDVVDDSNSPQLFVIEELVDE